MGNNGIHEKTEIKWGNFLNLISHASAAHLRTPVEVNLEGHKWEKDGIRLIYSFSDHFSSPPINGSYRQNKGISELAVSQLNKSLGKNNLVVNNSRNSRNILVFYLIKRFENQSYQ